MTEANDTVITRKERERQFRRNEIIAAAREVFTTRGFTEATLEEIAVKAEFGKGTLYNYFQGKEDLYAAVMADCFDQCQQLADTSFSNPGMPFRVNSQQFAASLLHYFYKNLGLVSLLMGEIHMPRERSLVRERFSSLVARLDASLTAAVEKREIKPCRTPHVAFLFIATIFSLFHKTVYENRLCRQTDAGIKPDFTDAEIQQSIEDVLALLDVTFYHGVLQPPVSISTNPPSTESL